MEPVIKELVETSLQYSNSEGKLELNLDIFLKEFEKTLGRLPLFSCCDKKLLVNIFKKIQKDAFILKYLHLYNVDNDVKTIIYSKVKRLALEEISAIAKKLTCFD